MRDIKFRMWSVTIMLSDVGNVYECLKQQKAFDEGLKIGNQLGVIPYDHVGDGSVFLQYTGKKCFNGQDVYEGDILFYEEGIEEGDERFYLVVTWIHEWSMFATLHVSEYNQYIIEGASALDEGMYWTYTIEGVPNYHYAGNIYTHKHLLELKD